MFNEALEIEFALTVDSTAYKVPGAQLKSFSIDLHNYGFTAEVDWWVSLDDREDIFFEFFTLHGLIQAGLKVAAQNKPDGDTVPDALTLTGLVTDKRLFEETYPGVEGNPVIFRRYWIQFADPAQVLWRQHHPCELYVDKTMKDVIDAHKGEKIPITYDMPALDVKHPILFLGLGAEGNQASFYDFLMWYIRSQNAVWTYGSFTNQYTLSQAKDPVSDAGQLDPLDIEDLELAFPEVPRFAVSVLNADAENAAKKDVSPANENAVDGVRRDVLIREPVAKRLDERVSSEQASLVTGPAPRLELAFCRFPTITARPGTYVSFSRDTWSADIYQKNKVYRILSMSLRASAENQDHHAGLNEDAAAYDVDVSATLELADDLTVTLPPFVAPRYPALIEGHVVSEEGAEEEETYQIQAVKEEQAGSDRGFDVEHYKVKIPLWQDIMVLVQFNANTLPAHFYFPYIKGARVLVALEFQRAWIKRFLEWRPRARLPQEGQGNHLLFGWKEKSQTSLSHFYQDNKPLLSLKRTCENDTELIELKEGTLIIQTREEES